MKKYLPIYLIMIFIMLWVLSVGAFLLIIFFKSLLESDPKVAAAIIGLMGVLIGAIWTHYNTRRREINSRHFLEKKNAYMVIIRLIFDVFKATKNNTEIPEEEVFERLFKFKRKLMVWGSREVIEALESYEKASVRLSKDKNPTETLILVDNVLRAIRKDLGHKDVFLQRGTLVSMFIVADEKEKIISDIKKGIANE